MTSTSCMYWTAVIWLVRTIVYGWWSIVHRILTSVPVKPHYSTTCVSGVILGKYQWNVLASFPGCIAFRRSKAREILQVIWRQHRRRLPQCPCIWTPTTWGNRRWRCTGRTARRPYSHGDRTQEEPDGGYKCLSTASSRASCLHRYLLARQPVDPLCVGKSPGTCSHCQALLATFCHLCYRASSRFIPYSVAFCWPR